MYTNTGIMELDEFEVDFVVGGGDLVDGLVVGGIALGAGVVTGLLVAGAVALVYPPEDGKFLVFSDGDGEELFRLQLSGPRS